MTRLIIILCLVSISRNAYSTNNLPSSWKSTDIGAVELKGSATFENDSFVINASGRDIWDFQDEFHFVYQEMEGNFEIICKLNSLIKTDEWAKAGLMIRSSLDGNSAHAMMVALPDKKISFEKRDVAGGGTILPRPLYSSQHIWMRLVRNNNTIIAYESKDGKEWSVYYFTNIEMNSSVYAGLAVSSHKHDEVTKAVFTEVELVQTGGTTSASTTEIENLLLNTKEIGGTESIFAKDYYVHKSSDTLPYRLMRPEKMAKGEKYPLILFFHDKSDAGTDNEKHLKPLINLFADKQMREKFPCFVLSPQHSAKEDFSDWPSKYPTLPMESVMRLVKKLGKEERIDLKRVYLIGVSSGGTASMEAMIRNPEKFTAALILGSYFDGFSNEKNVKKISNKPLWFFFGGKDPATSSNYINYAMSNLKKSGANPTVTVSPYKNYDLYVSVLKDQEVLSWLFSHKN